MQKRIFVINGSGGVGKDSFVNMVSEELSGKVVNFSTIDKIKEIARMIGWAGAKTEKDRKFLSDLKTLITEYNDLPFTLTRERVDEFMKDDNLMMFIHIREPENIAKVVKAFNANTILVVRPGLEDITSNRSDGSVYDYSYDWQIINDGDLDNLRCWAIAFINAIKKETP